MVDRMLHSPMPFTAGGQTISDRLTAAKHSLAGSQLGKTVCKATTEESIGPKKKHLDYLLHCTHEPNISIPQLANLLIERAQNPNWCIVFKSLITIHNLMCYGNERFTQYLASSNANFDLGNFLDKTSVQGYDMSTHVRRYAKYISEKVYTYRLCAFDFCKVKRGKDDGLLRTMPAEKLLKTLPILQGQVDALLEFQVTSSELTNGIINSSFILLFRDLIRLFACYNDGIINLLEKYFDLNKKQCREALDLYKRFLTRMDTVADFLKVAESVGIDKGEIPDLARAPNSLLEALEAHLVALEGGKGGSGSRVASPTTTTQNAINSFTAAATSSDISANNIDDITRRKYLQDEEARLNALKEQRNLDSTMPSSGAANPFLSGSTTTSAPSATFNLLDSPPKSQPQSNLNDLLSLNTNPFLQNAESAANAVTSQVASPFDWTEPMNNTPAPLNAFNPMQPSLSPAPTNAFASDEGFANAFNGTSQPYSSSTANSLGRLDPLGSDLFGGGPSTGPTKPGQQQNGKLLKNDLDNSLASLAQNLNLKKQDSTPMVRAPVQWSGARPAMNPVQPGGWGTGGMAAGGRPPYGVMPMQPARPGQPPVQGWNASPMIPQQPGMVPNMQMNMMGGQQPGMFGGGMAPPMAGFPPAQASPQHQFGAPQMAPPVGGSQQQPLDPFGF